MIEDHHPAVGLLVHAVKRIVARCLWHTRQARNAGTNLEPALPADHTVLTIARKEIRLALGVGMIEIDVDAGRLDLLPVDGSLTVHLLRHETRAPVTIPAKSAGKIKICPAHALPAMGQRQARDVFAPRALCRNVHDTTCGRGLILRSCSRKAAVRPGDDIRLLDDMQGRVELREHPRHTIDIHARPVRTESTVLEVIVQDAARRADRRRNAEHAVERLCRITECLDRLARDIRRRERHVHRVLRPEEADRAASRDECPLPILTRRRYDGLAEVRLIHLRVRRALLRRRRRRPCCAQCRQCDRKCQIPFCHFHSPKITQMTVYARKKAVPEGAAAFSHEKSLPSCPSQDAVARTMGAPAYEIR